MSPFRFESSCARDGGMWWIILHWGDHIWSFFRRGAGNLFTMSHTATRAASWPYMDFKFLVTSVPRGADVSLYGIWAGSTHIWAPPSLHRLLGCIKNHTLYYYWLPKFQKNQYLDRYILGSSTCSTKELSITMTKILHAVTGGLLSYCDKVYSRGNINQKHRISGIMVSVLASNVVDHGFEPRLGQTKNYKIGICCFSGKHAALRRKSKDWLARIRIMCPNGVTFLPADCCFSELAL
jgi:hypothetical protein